MIFRCTAKLIKQLRLKDEDVCPALGVNNETLSSWHCHLFYIDRKKCIIFSHDQTLFTVVATGLVQSDLKNFGDLFRKETAKVLERIEEVSPEVFLKKIDNGTDSFMRTNSRSVLGSMNEFIFTCKYGAALEGGLDRIDSIRLSGYLNQTPMKAIKMSDSSTEIRRLLGLDLSPRRARYGLGQITIN